MSFECIGLIYLCKLRDRKVNRNTLEKLENLKLEHAQIAEAKEVIKLKGADH